jgi:hypothetical protein
MRSRARAVENRRRTVSRVRVDLVSGWRESSGLPVLHRLSDVLPRFPLEEASVTSSTSRRAVLEETAS